MGICPPTSRLYSYLFFFLEPRLAYIFYWVAIRDVENDIKTTSVTGSVRKVWKYAEKRHIQRRFQ